MENVLELGSVVKLKATGLELTVIGYYPIDEKSGETYDYLCVNHFLGTVKDEDMIAINEIAIDSVVFHGYRNEEAEEVLKLVAEYEK